jgi:two-component system, chemotaxis family, response regulator Rcp1
MTGKQSDLIILLVEDNPGDVILIKEALHEGAIRHALHVTEDGEDALKFFKKKDIYAGMPRPDLILLDLNLPRKNGREVLAEIKSDPELLSIPVVVLTSSEEEEDIMHSYSLHANCYISKPVGFDQFAATMQSIGDFWFGLVKLPPRKA